MCQVRWTGAGLMTSDTVFYTGGDKHERRLGTMNDEERAKCLLG